MRPLFGFLNVHHTIGEGLMKYFLGKVNGDEIDIFYMRGQAYDHGASISENNKGAQERILELNQRALYVPCGSHTWNWVTVDAAKPSNYAGDFFFFGGDGGNFIIIYRICGRWGRLTSTHSL